MDSLLKKKFDSLQNAEDFECWYLVKQPTEFSSICYLVSILEKYQNEHSSDVFQTYVESKISDINKERHLDISSNYRALRIAAFYGLIKMETSSYQDSILTETYYEIKNRCEGNFENISTYSDIIQRQIEKMYASTSIDEKFDSVRSNFRLYPVLFLYKILLEIGYATNNYSISLDEYRYLVATSTTYNKFLETLLLVQKWRDASDSDRNLFSSFRGKFDNRFIQALKQLTTLSIDSSNISLKRECISEVAQKVFSFEKYLRNEKFDDSKLVDFLCSKEWLVDEKNDDKREKDSNEETKCEENNLEDKPKNNKPLDPPSQTIYYGVPGCGKSHQVNEKIKSIPDYNKVRTVFHPEYTNADFIGQILPEVSVDANGHSVVEYKFNPGPFTEIVRRAYLNPDEEFFLVIEEINRGNAAAIFGDMFQLLDRLDADEKPEEVSSEHVYGKNWSSYGVDNPDINAYIRNQIVISQERPDHCSKVAGSGEDANPRLYKSVDIESENVNVTWREKNGNGFTPKPQHLHFSANTAIRLPPNLSIYATMNTSDQNVFTLDNAFQRRWDMELVSNACKWDDEDHKHQAQLPIGDTDIRWETFREAINSEISGGDFFNADDKQLGLFFVEADGERIDQKKFANKVLKYLWADVFKRDTGKIFKSENLSKVVENFTGADAFDKVFVEDFVQSLKNTNDEIKNHE